MQEKETRSIDEIIGSGVTLESLTEDEQALVHDLAHEAARDFVTALDWMELEHGAAWRAEHRREIRKLMASLTTNRELSGVYLFAQTAGPKVASELEVFVLAGAWLMARSLDRLEDC